MCCSEKNQRLKPDVSNSVKTRRKRGKAHFTKRQVLISGSLQNHKLVEETVRFMVFLQTLPCNKDLLTQILVVFVWHLLPEQHYFHCNLDWRQRANMAHRLRLGTL